MIRTSGILASIFVMARLCSAQSSQANLSGLVSDAQGAVVVGAQVSIVNTATASATTVTTNDSGLYAIRALPIGRYTLSVEKPGFKKLVRTNLALSTGQSLELNLVLDVGAVTESINVAATASSIETRSSDVSQLIEAKTIEDMPIGDRRSMNIIGLTGAAVFVNYDAGGKPNFSLAGGRTQSQNFFIDGGTAQNMRLGIGQVDLDPPVETVAEVKILANSYSAEYGGSAGGVVIATTKSGTNQLQGTLFEYFRNEKLDAANYFAPVVNNEKVRAPLRYNVFGGTVGGPVRIPKLYNGKDKTFFFFAYEGSRRNEGVVRTLTVPTVAQRGGDFSLNSNPIFDPATTALVNGVNRRTQFPGNVIPASRLDAAARNIATYFPLPNRPPDNATGVNNFRANYVTQFPRNNYTAKVDHNLTMNDKLTFRYLYNSDDRFNTSVFPQEAAETLTDPKRHQHYTYLSYNKIITPTMLNELRYTYGNRINLDGGKGLGLDWGKTIGIANLPAGAFPTLNTTGYTSLGAGNQERRQLPIQQHQIIDNFSWVRGRHNLKLGFEYRKSMNYEINRPSASGSFNFVPFSTGQPGTAASGNGMASLLLGLMTNYTVRETEVLDRRSTYWAWFVQDDWKVNRDLTINFGLRWELDTPIIDVNNRMNGFSTDQVNPVSGTLGVVKFMGQNNWPTSPYRTDLNNFGPRVGLAYKLFGKDTTVLRGGYGVYFAHPFDAGAPSSASLGFEKSVTLVSPDQGITHPFVLSQGPTSSSLTSPTLDDRFGSVRVGAAPNTAVTFYEFGRSTGYSHQFNMGLQHVVKGGVLLEATYLGNISHKLASTNISLNQIPLEQAAAGRTSQQFRPYPQFSAVTAVLPSLGDSSYHALSTRFEKRFSNGLNFLGTYTWSKFLNNTSEGGGQVGNDAGPYSDFYNRRLDYGYSGNDVPHRMTFASVYELPFGTGRRFLKGNNPVRWVLGDWNLGVNALLQAGAPFTVTTQVDTRNNFSAGGLRADVIGNPNLDPSERTPGRWFNTAAFAQPAAFRNGTGGVGIVRADGKINIDISLLKNFPLGERRKLQLRGEFFNLTNHPNFGNPGGTFGGPGFGVINTADPGRRVQIGARLVW
jgi:hypothetical protein